MEEVGDEESVPKRLRLDPLRASSISFDFSL